jgi:lipopolysaccharide transport system permease protein
VSVGFVDIISIRQEHPRAVSNGGIALRNSGFLVKITDNSEAPPGAFSLAVADVRAALRGWRIVLLLGWTDIAKRYRRSVLGPFWLTLSMAGTIVALSLVYSYLFGHPLREYLPFFSVGFVLWSFVSQSIVESSTAYAANGSYLHQIRIPRFAFPLQLMFRQLVVLAHNAVVLLVILLVYPQHYSLASLLFVPAFLLTVLFTGSIATITATLCTRFRDLPQIVVNVMQIAFFVTPVLWMPDQLPVDRRVVVDGNPFAIFLELTRAPLLGGAAANDLWTQASVLTAVALVVAFAVFARYRARIPYWL